MEKFQFEFKKAFFQDKLGMAEHREFQILLAAISIMEKSGFSALTFGDLAKKCRISRALVHHYFADKSDLGGRLLQFCTSHLTFYVSSKLVSISEPLLLLEIYCRATLDWAHEYRGMATGLFLFLQVSSQDRALRGKNDELSAVGRQRIQNLLAALPGIEPRGSDEKAQVIQMLLAGAGLNLLTEAHNEKQSLKLRQSCVAACMRFALS